MGQDQLKNVHFDRRLRIRIDELPTRASSLSAAELCAVFGGHVAAFQMAMQAKQGGAAAGPGDSIINKISGRGSEANAQRATIMNNLMSPSDLTPKQLLKLQFKLADLTFQQTLIGRAGAKTGQGVQTLFKGQ